MSGLNSCLWLRPKTLSEALAAMEEHGRQALLYGGGTYIHEQRERGALLDIKAVVDLEGLGLRAVENGGDSIKAGAMVTLNEMIGAEAFRAPGFEALVQAAYAMGPDQIKNAATLGGAVSCGVPIIDLVPALISLEAKAVIHVGGQARTIDVAGLLSGPEKSLLGKTALVSGFHLPRPMPGSRSAFKKFRRSASDWALVNASASIRLDDAGHCLGARLVIGSRADGYFSLARAEQLLIGKRIDAETLDALPALAGTELVLKNHFTASADYKRSLCGFLARDAVAAAAGIERPMKEIERDGRHE